MKITEYIVSRQGMHKNYIIFTETDVTRRTLKLDFIKKLKTSFYTVTEVRENRVRVVDANVDVIFALAESPQYYFGLHCDMIFIHTYMTPRYIADIWAHFKPRCPDIEFFRY